MAVSPVGNSGDGGPATSAKLNNPLRVAVDPAGNVYIADTANNRVRKVDTTGTITNFAGDPNLSGDAAGTAGNTGDGGPATSARLQSPQAVAADAAGNVYIADQFNHRVRRVDAAGVITNFAGDPAPGPGGPGGTGDGGPATSATLYGPAGLAVDRAGNVYISDVESNNIRRVDTAGIITTFAGACLVEGCPFERRGNTGDGGPATSALLASPNGLAVDPAGNVYIADLGNNRVRRVDRAGIITNFAGSAAGTAGNSGDGGPAISSTLNWPRDVAVDSFGNVYIADGDNSRVRVVDTAGSITNLAGDPAGAQGNTGDGGPATSATLSIPRGVAVDGRDNVYIVDYGNHRVREVGATTTVTTTTTAPPTTTTTTTAPPTTTTTVAPKASPVIVVTATPAATTVGGALTATARVTGGSNPTGPVTFELYSDAACTTRQFTSARQLAGGTVTSDSFIAAQPGTYHWVATYSGDAGNNRAGPTACADPAGQVVVAPTVDAHTTLTKTANPTSGRAPLAVTYTYRQTNDGPHPISAVTLVDDKCSPVRFTGGDLNANAVLDPAETWIFTCSQTLTTPGVVTNTATAGGFDSVLRFSIVRWHSPVAFLRPKLSGRPVSWPADQPLRRRDRARPVPPGASAGVTRVWRATPSSFALLLS